ncbi:hypothetical protein [Microseira wollei]|uniref:Uncharacterized protein n=1 Tax=Microseira wollei NIES-4236 TaxID=2530354 RepID=A0AAV3XFZ3_9CYAN|nr:hypothetical protein [Microseira wollei]GET39359.1 hypothetical protein MiSe_41270 [Microseira wollei NIES-4236]
MKNSTKSLIWSSGFLLALVLALIPSAAQANAGVPMLFFVFPPLTMAIVPIILVEAVVYAKSLNLSVKQAFICSIFANLISTLAGFPLLWIAIVGVGMALAWMNLYEVANFILFPVWLGPAPNQQLLYLVPLSSVLFLVIAYFVSVFIENLLIRWLLEKVWHQAIEHSRLQKCVTLANLATYIPLAIFIALLLYVRGLQYVT